MGVFLPVKTMSALVNRWYERGEAEKEHGHRGRAIYIAEGIRGKKARKKMGREGRECIDKRGICDKIRKNAERKSSKQPVRSETGVGESPLDAGVCVPLRSGRRGAGRCVPVTGWLRGQSFLPN